MPAYFYPGADWGRMQVHSDTVRVAVMNPASGPSTASNSDYTTQVAAAQSNGLSVIGYVRTSYAARPVADVTSEISDYYNWYHVNGIFLDEVSSSCSDATSYYAQLYTTIKSRGGMAVLNPGTSTQECFAGVSDVIVTFEGPMQTYLTAYSAAPWETSYPKDHFWHIVYATATDAEMRAVVLVSQQRQAAWVYVTPGTLPNPYAQLPPEPYWSDEVSAVAMANSTPTPALSEAPTTAALLVIAGMTGLGAIAGRTYTRRVRVTSARMRP
ncbi:MAG: spherulation-specific family 4 protein [Candidatus Dormibacteria bacterium]